MAREKSQVSFVGGSLSGQTREVDRGTHLFRNHVFRPGKEPKDECYTVPDGTPALLNDYIWDEIYRPTIGRKRRFVFDCYADLGVRV